VSGLFPLPVSAPSGYLVLFEPGTPNDLIHQMDQTNWSDVVVIPDTGGAMGNQIEMFSKGCDISSSDISCFPSYSTVTTTNQHGFTVEPFVGPLTYTVTTSPNVLIIYSDVGVPEQATFTLIATGLAAWILTIAARHR
jgi:hypothetical protein